MRGCDQQDRHSLTAIAEVPEENEFQLQVVCSKSRHAVLIGICVRQKPNMSEDSLVPRLLPYY